MQPPASLGSKWKPSLDPGCAFQLELFQYLVESWSMLMPYCFQVTKDLQILLGTTDNWVLTHRVDLHNTLRDAATQKMDSRTIDISLSSRVASVVSACPQRR